MVRGSETYPLTVEITQWHTGIHPQVPDGEPVVFYSYRATLEGPYLPEPHVELAVCAVDSADLVLLCGNIDVDSEFDTTWPEDGDGWIGTGSSSDLSRTARVVLLPDQLLGDGNAGDPKDFDGYHPPEIPLPGDRLRTR